MSTQILGFKLSPQQARLWLLQQHGAADPMQCAIMIEGNLEVGRLRQVLQEIVDRHEMLRTTFQQRPGLRLPIQVIAERGAFAWRELGPSQANGVESLFEEEKNFRFNYAEGPLVRAALLPISAVRNVLVLTLPAICADASTLKNLFQEICDGLSGRSDQSEIEITQYVQFSEWQNQLLESEESRTGTEYWRQRLSNHPHEQWSLVIDRRSQGEHKFEAGVLRRAIEPPLLARMEAIASECGATISNFLLSCWHILLWRLTGEADIRVEVSFEGREFEELRSTMGVFQRWLPIDSHCSGNSQFQDFLKVVAESVTTASAAQDYFVAEQRHDAVGFAFEEWPSPQNASGLVLSFTSQRGGVERYQVKLQCHRRTDGVELEWHYDSAVVSEAAVARLAEQFQTLVQSARRDPETPLAHLEMVSAAERVQLIEEWNRTAVNYAGAECLHEQFAAQAARTPEAVAVVYEDMALTYAELERRANQLARYLQAQGVGPETVVGLLQERSLELVVSLLGVLKAGAAYLPLDAGYPEARLRYMLSDAGVRVLLTEPELLARVGAVDCEVMCVGAEWARIAECSAAPVASKVSAANVAYVIYTSGSTGQPKGVMVTHGGLVNYLNWCSRHYAVAETPATLVHTSVAFDLTVTSLLSPLVAGRTAKILSEDVAVDALSTALNSGDEFSLIKITPAQLDLLGQWLADKDNAVSTHAMVIGGEALHWSSLSFWRDRLPGVRLINEYGPTETVVGCCIYEVPVDASGSGAVPIGRPIANTQLHLLGSDLQLAPAGAAAELYIGGAGVARGYLNAPAVTAEKFIPNPFSSAPGARLYKSGDLVRLLPSQELEFIGRVDHQVKLRGFRIELGEIEATLKEHAAVVEAVAMLREDVAGDARLVAYCVMDQQRGATSDELQTFLKEKLPHYMIPAAIVSLKALPLTTNGKIDRGALPAPEHYQAKSDASYARPRTEVERTIVSLWQEMLRLERVGIYDNFFDLGGHSMLMVQLHSRLRGALGRDIPIVDLFGHPTISSLAEFLSQQNDGALIFQKGHDRAGNRRTSSKRQKQVRQNHRETARIAFAQEQ